MYASVIVPTYNRRAVLERTLRGLLNQTVSPSVFEVIVVDDCSSDDTEAFMKGWVQANANVSHIRHTENRGRVVTRNDGVVTARGEIVIFLDDDNVPEPNFVQAHIEYHKASGDDHVVVMGNVSFAPELVAGSNFARHLESRYLGLRSSRERARIDYANLPPRFLGTLNCSMHREDLIAIGMLDAGFRHYGGEDEYLGYCLSQAGVRIVFGENAKSVHYDDVSIKRYKNKCLETSSGGYQVILDKGGDYFEKTQVRLLLPVDWQSDSWKRIIAKCWIKIVLNPANVFVLEQLAILSDQYKWLYCPPWYRLLLAGWSLGGLRSAKPRGGLVTYGKTAV